MATASCECSCRVVTWQCVRSGSSNSGSDLPLDSHACCVARGIETCVCVVVHVWVPSLSHPGFENILQVATAVPPIAVAVPASTPAPRAPPSVHKNTTLIPGWSRPLSSQQLHMECQKVAQPLRSAGPRDCVGVLEMEVMKFVAYCGGVTLKFRIDELQYGPVENLTWGLASTRPCPALVNALSAAAAAATGQQCSSPTQHGSPDVRRPLHEGKGPGSASPAAATAEASTSHAANLPVAGMVTPVGGSSKLAANKSSPLCVLAGAAPPGSAPTGFTPGSASRQLAGSSAGVIAGSPAGTAMQVDSVSRKPLHMICSATSMQSVCANDVLTIELAPQEDKQPVILATLKYNGVVLLQSSLPCSSISSLQLYPFITVQPGMTVSLHEAITPSPLFTWYAPSGSVVSTETTYAELDTCVKYNTAASTPASLHNGAGTCLDFHGSTTFSANRHRWTVQLDNYSSSPTHIFVGVVTSSNEHALGNTNSNILASVQGPLRSIAGAASTAAAAASALLSPMQASSLLQASAPSGLPSIVAPSPSAAAGASSSAPGMWPSVPSASGGSGPSTSAVVAPDTLGASPRAQSRWGAWIRLPGRFKRQMIGWCYM